MNNLKLGIQLYGVRNDISNDMEKTLASLSEMGYEYVEWACFSDNGFFGKSADEIKELLEKYNLKTASAHLSIPTILEKPAEVAKVLKKLGITYCIIPVIAADWLKEGETFRNSLKMLSDVADFAAENGFKVLFHNHRIEFRKYGDEYILDALCKASDKHEILPQLDVAWAYFAGVNPVCYIKKYDGKIKLLHMKDFYINNQECEFSGSPDKGIDENFVYRPVGHGMVNIPEILETAKKYNVEYLIVEQDEATETSSLEGARISAEYLKAHIKF